VRALPILLLIAWLLASNNSVCAENHIFFQDENLIVIGDSRLEPEAAYLVQSYPEARSDLEKTLGWELLSRPRVYLTGNREEFERISGSPFVSALAIPSEHIILVYITPATSKPYVLNETFRHELCHLLLHDHIKEPNLPRWLDEGVCQWISGTLGEILRGEGAAADRVETAGRFIPLNRLAVSFPRDGESLFLAYEEGRSFVEFVAGHYGRDGVVRILKRLGEADSDEKDPIEAAVAGALGKSFREVQEEWIEDMGRRRAWLVWTAQHMYEIVFFGAAVLSVAGFVRMKVRKGRLGDEDGEEEE
jgi:hypothetical protein